MQTFDHDVQALGRERSRVARRVDGTGELVGRALAANRAEPLHQAAIMHLQRTAGNASVAQLLADGEDHSPVLDVVGSGGGQALDEQVRKPMEQHFGQDFGDVRIHTDSKASDSAKAVQAHAYTVGSDIVFQSGRYSPGSGDGQRMLAHELTHVVQQRSGPVDGTPTSGGIKVSDPSDRFEREAESTADRVMSGISAAPTAAAGAQRQVQREDEAPEEEVQETAQGYFVQREDEAPEEEVQETAQGFFLQREEEAGELEEEG